MGVPADIAPTIAFLVSDDSAYYNGAEIYRRRPDGARVTQGHRRRDPPPAMRLAAVSLGGRSVGPSSMDDTLLLPAG